MHEQPHFVANTGGNLGISLLTQSHSKPCLHLKRQEGCMFSADRKIWNATLQENKQSSTFILKRTTYCCFLGFKYLTGLLKVTLLFNALTLQRAWFELFQKRVCPLPDFEDLVCIFTAVKYWKQKCESTSREKSWLKTGTGPSQRTLFRATAPTSSTAREPTLETMGCQCCAAAHSPASALWYSSQCLWGLWPGGHHSPALCLSNSDRRNQFPLWEQFQPLLVTDIEQETATEEEWTVSLKWKLTCSTRDSQRAGSQQHPYGDNLPHTAAGVTSRREGRCEGSALLSCSTTPCCRQFPFWQLG